MAAEQESDFITRKEFELFAEELLKKVGDKIARHHSKRERDTLIAQGQWAPPLPKENP